MATLYQHAILVPQSTNVHVCPAPSFLSRPNIHPLYDQTRRSIQPPDGTAQYNLSLFAIILGKILVFLLLLIERSGIS